MYTTIDEVSTTRIPLVHWAFVTCTCTNIDSKNKPKNFFRTINLLGRHPLY